SYFEKIQKGQGDPEAGDWPKQAADLEAHLKSGGTMTFLKDDGSQYKVGPKKKESPRPVAKSKKEDVTKDITPRKKVAKAPDVEIQAAAYAKGPEVPARPGPADSGAGTVKARPGNKTPTPPPVTEGIEQVPRIGLLVSKDGIDTFSADLDNNRTVRLDS